MKYTKCGINTTFVRLFRIQVSSKERNKNVYPDHSYNIKIRLNYIGYPYNNTYVNDFEVRAYFFGSEYYFVNKRRVYVKKTIDGDNEYIDFGVDIPAYSTIAHVEIDTVNEGSVTWLFDNATKSEYTLIDPLSSTGILNNSVFYSWYSGNTSKTFRVLKGLQRIVDGANNVTAYVMSDGSIFNGDNASFTVTISSNDDYSQTLSVTCKRNCLLIVENLSS